MSVVPPDKFKVDILIIFLIFEILNKFKFVIYGQSDKVELLTFTFCIFSLKPHSATVCLQN